MIRPAAWVFSLNDMYKIFFTGIGVGALLGFGITTLFLEFLL